MTEPFNAWDVVFAGAMLAALLTWVYKLGYRRGVRGTLARIARVEFVRFPADALGVQYRLEPAKPEGR